ncbi:hypothetical protein GCM10025865_10640 [Paraoerskovia sediminicola]|uniref:Potassium channel domain-containing protein n=2 Tax=Paraoerskovia sediminicola TaxID=1138587 RepID=A0ABM8G139_9CELL|nr:hypothetical protein GCM10025865_10640 [Paraoerskovia sediminicola]
MLSLVPLTGDLGSAGRKVAIIGTTALVAATLLLSLRASGLAQRHRRRAEVVVGVLVALLALAVVTDLFGLAESDAALGVSPVLASFALVAPIFVVRRLLRHHSVTLSTLLGALTAYLLIGVAYYFAFLSVDGIGGQFFGEAEPTTTFMYFSLTTITTLGYGDVAAATDVGRLLATSEAIIGQVYLVTVVAMIVSLGAAAWQGGRPGETSGAGQD